MFYAYTFLCRESVALSAVLAHAASDRGTHGCPEVAHNIYITSQIKLTNLIRTNVGESKDDLGSLGTDPWSLCFLSSRRPLPTLPKNAKFYKYI